MKRIVVLVSGGGTNLQALLDAQDRGEIPGGQITCVIASKPGVYALERAAAHGIPGKVLERKAYPDVHAYSAAMRDLLLAEQADLVVYAGFLTILDEQVVDAFPGKMMNIHPALIPSFCGKGYYGLHVHEAVLQSGVKLTGATDCRLRRRSHHRPKGGAGAGGGHLGGFAAAGDGTVRMAAAASGGGTLLPR